MARGDMVFKVGGDNLFIGVVPALCFYIGAQYQAAVYSQNAIAPDVPVSATPSLKSSIPSTDDLPNPGKLGVNQIDSYSKCDPSTNRVSQLSFQDCKVGQSVGYYLIAKSINSNHTVSFYAYHVQPAQFVGETWSPELLTYAENQVIWNQCGKKITLSKTDYSQQYFTIEISAGDDGCPQ